MFEGWPRPLILAHRGASAHAPENTLAAFTLAMRDGADGIELDAKLTADGRVVVLHDATLDRTTSGRGSVAALPLEKVRQLDAGAWFDDTYRGERVPTLDEVFESSGREAIINIELANYRTPSDRLAEAVCRAINRHGRRARTLFSSFLSRNLAACAHLLPDIPRALLSLPGLFGLWARAVDFPRGDYHALHANVSDTTAGLVRRVRSSQRRIHVWTVNHKEEMARLLAWNADGIITDDPAAARRAIRDLR